MKPITYQEFLNKKTFTKEEIIASSYGTLTREIPHEVGGAPQPPMLMYDRVIDIEKKGNKGRIIAEKDIHIDDWFFQCHFHKDPVMPGCLGVDAVWQLIGLYIAVNGAAGYGRALGCKEVDFFGQVRPLNKLIRYEVEIRRFTNMPDQGAALAIGTGKVFVDGEHIYTITDAKVGLFKGINYPDFPMESENSMGGIMVRES